MLAALCCLVSVGVEEGHESGLTDKLIFQRHLLKLHTMDSGIGGTKQRCCCDDKVTSHLQDELMLSPKEFKDRPLLKGSTVLGSLTG